MRLPHSGELDYAPRPPPWWTRAGLRGRLVACLFGLLDFRHLLRSRKMWAGVALAALVTVMLAAAGYSSNEAAGRACEREVAGWLARDVMRGKPFSLSPTASPGSEAIFAAAGSTAASPASGDSPAPFPWCEISRARSSGPFVVEVDYGWCLEGEYGEGGTRRYLCLFGRRIKLADRLRWCS